MDIQKKGNKIFPDQGSEEGYLLEDDDMPIPDHWLGREEVNIIEICKEEREEHRERPEQGLPMPCAWRFLR